jgi:hypothetical protein
LFRWRGFLLVCETFGLRLVENSLGRLVLGDFLRLLVGEESRFVSVRSLVLCRIRLFASRAHFVVAVVVRATDGEQGDNADHSRDKQPRSRRPGQPRNGGRVPNPSLGALRRI